MKINLKLLEQYEWPSTILFRGIELKLLEKKMKKYLYIRPGLDLGCGDGIAAEIVFSKKIDYGLDFDSQALDKAKKKGIYKKIIKGKGEEIDLKDDSIKLIFCNCTLEHIEDLEKVLDECRRILKKNGIMIFTVPSEFYKGWNIFSKLKLKFLAKIYGKIRDKKFEHYNCYSLKKWKNILEKNGFKLKESYFYIDKKTMEWWDFLWLTQFILAKVTPKLRQLVYKKNWRNKIADKIEEAKILKKGAGLCLAIQNNKNGRN